VIPTIIEFKIGRGRSIPSESEAWDRRYLELTVRLPEGSSEAEFWAALRDAEGILEKWFSSPKAEAAPAPTTPTMPISMPMPTKPEIPIQAQPQAQKPGLQLDPKSLEALPWKDREGNPSEPGTWGWILGPGSIQGSPPGASDLVKALEASKGRLSLGDYEYAYSSEKTFIHRRPRKR
jgi:hypothetical protein